MLGMNDSRCSCAPEMTVQESSAWHRKKAESQNRLMPVSPVFLPEDEHFVRTPSMQEWRDNSEVCRGKGGSKSSPVRVGTGLEMNVQESP